MKTESPPSDGNENESHSPSDSEMSFERSEPPKIQKDDQSNGRKMSIVTRVPLSLLSVSSVRR
jgi:hypothetical protein